MTAPHVSPGLPGGDGSDSVRSSIARALKMVEGESRAFAREFLFAFDSDISGDLVALSNNAALNISECGSFAITSVPDNTPNAPPGGLSIVSGWVPVFRSCGLTLGMHLSFSSGIESYGAVPTMPSAGEGSMQNIGRFVRDEENGELLFVSKTYAPGHSGDGLVSLNHLKYSPGGWRRQLFLRCNPGLLRKGRQAENSHCFEESALVCSVMSQEPICPMCSSPLPSSSCDCCGVGGHSHRGPLLSSVAEDPDSCAVSSRNFRHRFGDYGGSLILSFRNSHRAPFEQRRSRMSAAMRPFLGDAGRSMLLKLRDAGVQNRMLQGLEGNLPRGVMPAAVADAPSSHADPKQAPDASNCKSVMSHADGVEVELGFEFESQEDIVTQIFQECDVEGREPGERGPEALENGVSGVVSSFHGGSDASPADRSAESSVEKDGQDASTDRCHTNDVETSMSAYQLERRRKNREAAARSNLRRRMYRETLKKDLTEAQARKDELLEYREKLERENTDLKNIAAGKWISSRRDPDR